MNNSKLDPVYWDQRYRDSQTGWDRGTISPRLQYWLDRRFIAPCRILVPGAGHGHEVVHLAKCGFQVTALDFANTPVQRLKKRVLKEGVSDSVSVIQADVLHFQPDSAFEAIYEQTCLCAIHPDSWADYEQRLWNWLIPGGQLLISFMQTHKPGGPPFHCDQDQMRELFPNERWRWPETLDPTPHPSGLEELSGILLKTV